MKIRYNEKLIQNYPRVPFLNPLLGNPGSFSSSKIGVYDKNQVLKWESEGKKFLEYSEIKDCDYVVYPKNFRIDFFKELKNESNFCRQYNKKIIVFYDDDNEFPINIDNCIVFRNSLSTYNPKNEYCMPAFIPPLEGNDQKVDNREISIGYVGYLKASCFNLHNKIKKNLFIRRMLYKWVKNTKTTYLIKDSNCIEPLHKRNTLGYLIIQRGIGIMVRSKVIKDLYKYSNYKKNFVKRTNKLSPEIRGLYRKEYIDSIYSNTFSLAVRGDGNFSYRLYEIMSAGRIPLFIDTNCRMPFEDEINYKSLFVYCPFDDIKNVDNYISKFLKEHKDLEDVRHRIRKTYEDYLTYPSWCKKICNNLQIGKY